MRVLTIILCLALAQSGLSPAWAQTVEVPEVEPVYELGGPDGTEFVTANRAADLAMLYHVPTAPRDGTLTVASAGASPLTIQAASGAETRLLVDVGAADQATEGMPWYGKVLIVAGCVVLVGLASWGIYEASRGGGSHDQDSSTHYTIVGDDGATMNIRIGSDNNSSSMTTGW